jgi:hypothetical protein
LKSAAGGASVAAFSCYDSVERSKRAATSRSGKRSSSTGIREKKLKQMNRTRPEEDEVLKSSAGGASVATLSCDDSVERSSRGRLAVPF